MFYNWKEEMEPEKASGQRIQPVSTSDQKETCTINRRSSWCDEDSAVGGQGTMRKKNNRFL